MNVAGIGEQQGHLEVHEHPGSVLVWSRIQLSRILPTASDQTDAGADPAGLLRCDRRVGRVDLCGVAA